MDKWTEHWAINWWYLYQLMHFWRLLYDSSKYLKNFRSIFNTSYCYQENECPFEQIKDSLVVEYVRSRSWIGKLKKQFFISSIHINQYNFLWKMKTMGNILGPYLSWYNTNKPKCKMSNIWSLWESYFFMKRDINTEQPVLRCLLSRMASGTCIGCKMLKRERKFGIGSPYPSLA